MRNRRSGKGGAQRGHSFFGNQYTKIAKYARGRSAARRKRRAENQRLSPSSFTQKIRGPLGVENVKFTRYKKTGMSMMGLGAAASATGVGALAGIPTMYYGAKLFSEYQGRTKTGYHLSMHVQDARSILKTRGRSRRRR